MTRPPRYVLSLLLLASILVAPGMASERRDQEGFKQTEEEKRLVDLTNAARRKHKIPPLRPNATLFAVARAHARNMAQKGELEHVLDGKKPSDRVREAGYTYSWVGENLACGEGWTLADVVQAWMDSPGHRDNLLRKEYQEIGIGLARGRDGMVYYTQVFATAKRR